MRVSRTSNPYRWDRIRRGDAVPEGAVHAGRTATDGIVFVALTADGDCGKLNTDFSGNALNIWASSSDGPGEEGWVLVKKAGSLAAWRAVSKGHKLPDRAVFAGERLGDGGDGPMYVARAGNESGRLLLDGDLVREIQCHHKGSQEDGEVLIFEPSLLPEEDATNKGPLTKWRARWMWYDAGVPLALIPGPLSRLSRQGTQLNPFRWSKWQDLPSTVYELEGYRDTPQASRPVRIETTVGICDVYQNTPDLVLILSRILRGEEPAGWL